MDNRIKPNLSKKNPYYISKHRYYELRHFCFQYPEWLENIRRLDSMMISPSKVIFVSGDGRPGNPTQKIAMKRASFTRRIEMLEECSRQTDTILGPYILEGVINGYSYETVKARLEIPCCRDTYYDLFRKFYWHLSKLRD